MQNTIRIHRPPGATKHKKQTANNIYTTSNKHAGPKAIMFVFNKHLGGAPKHLRWNLSCLTLAFTGQQVVNALGDWHAADLLVHALGLHEVLDRRIAARAQKDRWRSLEDGAPWRGE